MTSLRFSVSLHYSPWPGLTALSVLGAVSSILILLKTNMSVLLGLGVLSFGLIVIFWSKDMVWEAESGEYSLQTLDNLKFSFCLLVLSEVMLFLSFLWAFFHLALSPSVWSSHMWPPVGIVCVNPLGIPLLNTLLLVSSGVTLTWGHHLVMSGQLWESLGAVAATCLLGLFFLLNQVVELVHCPFTISDSSLGSVFFTLTGFHGFHVLVGVVLLMVSGVRLVFYHFSALNHAFFEMSIWYWHLVDCVWLLVYSVIYWWGS